MKSLPAKSLLRFRSVSKPWKSLIDSPDFIAHYAEHKFVSIADDDTFPQHKLPFTLPIMLKCPSIICSSRGMLCSSSHGLLCLYTDDPVEGDDDDGTISTRGRAVLWNPSIRKAVGIAVDVAVPDGADGIYDVVVGFGVCRETSDPKLLKIAHIVDWDDMVSETRILCHVEVFTLSMGVWRVPYTNLVCNSVRFYSSQLGVDVDGVLYWLARKHNYNNLIVSFDITSEEFRQVKLPDSLGIYNSSQCLSLSKLRDSLVVLQHGIDAAANKRTSVVWMMDGGGSFTKLFDFYVNTPHDSVKGFRKSGEPIIELFADHLHKLVVFKPYLERIDDIGIADGSLCSFSVYPYVETLLLHDHPNLKMFCLGI